MSAMSQQPSPNSDGDVPIPSFNARDLLPPAPNKQHGSRFSPKLTFHALDQCNIPCHRFLSHSEWIVFAHGVGAFEDTEHHVPIYPKSWWWPPRGLPQGLYREVVYQRTKSFYIFHITSILRWPS
ncbi:hypothetical protein BGZ63DRAFT_441916 [Mariannaea sp. PMI_226]|nr:hypothetical protein BGZ63DRAFT_441916 [Mariannaea sp. PMI_226]